MSASSLEISQYNLTCRCGTEYLRTFIFPLPFQNAWIPVKRSFERDKVTFKTPYACKADSTYLLVKEFYCACLKTVLGVAFSPWKLNAVKLYLLWKPNCYPGLVTL